MEFAHNLATQYIPFLFALCFHEYAHAFVAKKKGDDTAETMGRLTLNPASHMDMIGTLVLPVLAIGTGSNFFFGWAKPVPVNYRNLKNPRNDMFWIAIAGPLSNVLLYFVGIFILLALFILSPEMKSTTTPFSNPILASVIFFMQINIVLAIFNMLPLHPLDGGKVLARFLPEDLNRKLEENQQVLFMILVVMMVTGAFKIIHGPVLYLINVAYNAAQYMAHM